MEMRRAMDLHEIVGIYGYGAYFSRMNFCLGTFQFKNQDHWYGESYSDCWFLP